MRHQLRPRSDGSIDRAIGDLASRQLGLVTRAQLLALGLGPGAIAHRVRLGRLRIVHRGVYLVGHEAMPELARELAATLAVGTSAVLSHRSAARVWGLIPVRAQLSEVEVTVIGRKVVGRPGIRVHRSIALDSRDRRHRGPLALTAPARTIVDIAPSLVLGELEQAIAQAGRRSLARDGEIRAALTRAGRRRGSAAVRGLLDGGRVAYTRSVAERKLLSLIRSAALPEPETNVGLAGFELDFLWRNQKVVVEVDGFAFHSDRAAFENDRRRDARLVALGYRVLRITWRQLCDDPVATVARVATVLASTGPPDAA